MTTSADGRVGSCPRTTTTHTRGAGGLAANPNVHFHFTLIGASWINQIESWFGIITRQAIRRGSLQLRKTLIKQIRHYIAHWNANSKPFTWTVTADEILTKVRIVEGVGTDLVAEPNAAALVPA
jgi:hypothetical protein